MRTYRKIHVICDHAAFHKNRAVRKYLEPWEHRNELHYLPTYAPETITRNHQRAIIDQLLTEVFDLFAAEQSFPIETTLNRLAS